MAGKIFLNYRRSDAEAWADRLYERLTARLPQLDIFMDIVGKIPLGRPWATWLDSQVAECDLMLVLIGRSWVAEFEARDRPAERDYVRVEIESALARQIPVVPVFLGDTPVPPEDSLPPSVRPLLGMQAARLQRGSFEADVNALIEGALQSMSLPSSRAGTPSPTVLHPAPPPAAQPDPPLAERLVEIGIAGAGQVRTLVPGEGDGFTDQGGLPELVLAPRGDCPAPPGSEADAAYAAGMATLGAPLAVGRYPVTVDEFAAFVRETGHRMPETMWTYEGLLHRRWKERSDRSYRSPGFEQTAHHPVIGINWHDAVAYAGWLARKTGRPYRLLSQAEWWYVVGRWRERLENPSSGWSEMDPIDGTAPVDTFQAGPWGLYAQPGRVWEWCSDHWGPERPDAAMSPSRFHDGITVLRDLRGGVLHVSPNGLGRACETWGCASYRASICGLRIARPL